MHRVWLSDNSNTRDPVAQQFSQTVRVEEVASVSILGIVHLRTGNTDSPRIFCSFCL